MNLPNTDPQAAGTLTGLGPGAVTSGRLRILIVSDVCHPRVNGVSTSIETFSNALARLGVRITLVAPEYPGASHALDTAAASCAEIVRLPSRGVPFDPADRLMHGQQRSALDRRLASADSWSNPKADSPARR